MSPDRNYSCANLKSIDHQIKIISHLYSNTALLPFVYPIYMYSHWYLLAYIYLQQIICSGSIRISCIHVHVL